MIDWVRALATAHYGSVANEIRLYDPERLKTAARTSEPGVLVHSISRTRGSTDRYTRVGFAAAVQGKLNLLTAIPMLDELPAHPCRRTRR
jgi:hypothetical protein